MVISCSATGSNHHAGTDKFCPSHAQTRKKKTKASSAALPPLATGQHCALLEGRHGCKLDSTRWPGATRWAGRLPQRAQLPIWSKSQCAVRSAILHATQSCNGCERSIKATRSAEQRHIHSVVGRARPRGANAAIGECNGRPLAGRVGQGGDIGWITESDARVHAPRNAPVAAVIMDVVSTY